MRGAGKSVSKASAHCVRRVTRKRQIRSTDAKRPRNSQTRQSAPLTSAPSSEASSPAAATLLTFPNERALLCVAQRVPQGRTESGGRVLAANAGPRVPSGGVTLKRCCTYRPSVIYLIVNKLLSLSPPPFWHRRGVPAIVRTDARKLAGV